MTDPDSPITPNEMAACVEREVAMRLRVYPRWVQAGKMRRGKRHSRYLDNEKP